MNNWIDMVNNNLALNQAFKEDKILFLEESSLCLMNMNSYFVFQGEFKFRLILSEKGLHLRTNDRQFKTNGSSMLDRCVFRDRLFHKATSDVDIVVEGTRIPAHRLILSLVSPVFTAMFEHQMQESAANEIVISDFSEEVVRSMLRCIYDCDAVKSEVEKHADQLLFIANKYDLSSLENSATNHTIASISLDNAIELLFSANKFDQKRIKTAAMKFIVQHNNHFFKQSEFAKTLGFDLMSELLEYMTDYKRVV